MLTRRRLILTVLGTLGAVACAPASQVVKFSSPPKSEPVKFTSAIVYLGTRANASLFVSSGAEITWRPKALTKAVTVPLVGVGAAVVAFGVDFEHAFTGIRESPESLIVHSEAEAQAFLKQMVAAIQTADRRLA